MPTGSVSEAASNQHGPPRKPRYQHDSMHSATIVKSGCCEMKSQIGLTVTLCTPPYLRPMCMRQDKRQNEKSDLADSFIDEAVGFVRPNGRPRTESQARQVGVG